jgi:hypothetical protein
LQSVQKPLLFVQVAADIRTVVDNRRLVGKGGVEHRAEALDQERNTRPAGDLPQTVHERLAACLHLLEYASAAELCERGQAGGDAGSVAVEAAPVEHRAVARQLHDLLFAGHRANRKAARQRLGEDRQVGRDAQPSLRTAQPDPKASDHLVEDEHHAVSVA